MEKDISPLFRRGLMLKLTLLFTGSMTVLAGAEITAAIPEIQAYF